MGAVIGHWKDLTEAQRLTQSQLIPGVVEEIIKRNNPVEKLPVALALGKSIKWNREKVTLEGSVLNVDIGDKMTWASSVEYTPKESELKRKAIARVLDNFIADVYGTINNYEAQMLWEVKKGMMIALGDALIYDDETFNSKQIQGMHAWAAENCTGGASDGKLDIDMGGAALSTYAMRTLVNEMKGSFDYWLFPPEIALRVDAAYEERGFTGLASATAGTMMGFTRAINEAGAIMYYYAGKPILRSDFLVAEELDTGRGTTARAKYSSNKAYSIFAVKGGDIFAGNNGLCLAFGNPEMQSKLYKVEYFDKLEDYDAKGIRLITYTTSLLGSKLSLGRIHDILDAALVVGG
jgi:hypothetical protein